MYKNSYKSLASSNRNTFLTSHSQKLSVLIGLETCFHQGFATVKPDEEMHSVCCNERAAVHHTNVHFSKKTKKTTHLYFYCSDRNSFLKHADT